VSADDRGGVVSRTDLDALADRAAEDGDHAIVAAYQVATRSDSSPQERRAALRRLKAYLRSL
jgi:hypothetical protein